MYRRILAGLCILALIGTYIGVYCSLGPYIIDAPTYGGWVFDTRTIETRHEQPWRWYSYSLVHANANHLSGNVVALAFYGIPLVVYELSLPLIHTVAILNGALAMSWQHYLYGEEIIDIGASAGVYGIYGAYIPLVIWETDISKRALYGGVILTYSIAEIVSIEVKEIANPNTSHAGHVGGFVGGLFTAFACAPAAAPKWVRCAAMVLALGITAVNIGVTMYV